MDERVATIRREFDAVMALIDAAIAALKAGDVPGCLRLNAEVRVFLGG